MTFWPFFYIWFGFPCAHVSSGHCDTTDSWKIGNFVSKASESCENCNISNEGMACTAMSMLVEQIKEWIKRIRPSLLTQKVEWSSVTLTYLRDTTLLKHVYKIYMYLCLGSKSRLHFILAQFWTFKGVETF